MAKQVANDNVTKLPGHIEVDLPVRREVVVVTRWYVGDDQNL